MNLKKYLCLLLILVPLTISGCSSSEITSSQSNESSQSSASQSITRYTITWKNETGALLTTTLVDEGDVPSYSYNKQDTVEWNYTVEGWSLTQNGSILASIPAASADATYYAIVSQVKQTYTITFNANGGTTVSPITRDYGSVIQEPSTKPTMEGYRFVAWCSDSALTTAVEWPVTLTGNVTYYASWNEQVDVGAYLSELLADYDLNPFGYIPETMQPGYSANLVNPSSLVTDYSSFVSTTSIKNNGFGEQWKMVLDNLQQSMTFFNSLSVVEGLITTSVTAFNNYFDQNPSDTAHYNFASGIYSVTIDFDGSVIFYVLDYTATFPGLGEQSAQIALAMNIGSKAKTVRIQLGEANALTYTITENAYTFAIKYLGVRRAYFSVERGVGNAIEGHINEYLTVSGVGIHSAADFYIGTNYVSVVGNKAGGMIGFTGYISELYNVATGKLLGYEVREELSSIVYNTLWFDLNNLGGINSIKYQAATNQTSAAFYVNGSSTAWANKKVGGFSAKTLSRRFDLEFRTQYFYTYNSAEQTYEVVGVNVPMLFVQEENYATLTSDITSVNSGVTVNVTLSSTHLTKLESDYDTLITVFITNKDTITEDIIIAFIGSKITYDS